MRKVFYAIVLFASCFSINAYCQNGNTVLQNAINGLKTLSADHIIEKAYLHFDKPYYAAGDTIYFKAYVTYGERHQLSELSGILHVDLINNNNKINQSIKLQLNKGISWGDFALPDSLAEGNYRVMAYTQWMRNDGDNSYFEQVIPIGSGKNDKIPENSTAPKTAVNAPPDLQFFPEGGELVEGIPSKVAFKAISSNGLGADVNGVIVDNTGKEISKFSSTHLGMGYFYLTPVAGKIYRAKFSYADGKQNFVDLPQVSPKGIVLKINNDSLDRATIQLVANESYFAENRSKPVGLLIYSGGLVTTVTVPLDSLATGLAILKRRLRAGITRITLFSATGEPISERLIFIEKPDQLSLTLSGGKIAYNKREKVSFNINTANRADSIVFGHLSVSVIDEAKVPFDGNTENTICNYLLLTSDLKGYIEQPNYYFTNTNAKTRAGLDLVMLTHGYHRFEWKQLLNGGYPPVAYQPERNLEIAGTAKGIFGGKPVVNGTVSLIAIQGGPYISTKTDEKGRFRFSNLVFEDTTKFVLQAVNAKGKNSTQLLYDNELAAPVTATKAPLQNENIDQIMGAYLQNNKEQYEDYLKYGGSKGRILKEINIRSVKREDNYRSSSLVGPGHADQVVHAEQIENIGGPLSTRLAGMFHGPLGFKITQGGLPGLVVVDGVDMGKHFRLDDINGNDVETVELMEYGSASIYGVQGGEGVLVITTKQGTGRSTKDIASVGVLPITANGFHKAREFYSPKYEHQEVTNRKDLRTTIYWKPEIVTDKDGNASFEYYNADGTGTYRVVIEGVDDKGDIGRKVYRYKVE